MDGRKKERICKKCLDEITAISEAKYEKNMLIRSEIDEALSKLITEEKVRTALVRIRSNPFHQLVTKLLAYEMISSYIIPINEEENSISSLMDVFIKASEIDDVNTGTPLVAFAIENVINAINNATKEDMIKKGVEEPYSLGFIIGS
ncbi:hypothetical protein KAU33_15785 [Candidatus Dependentiae bacterium]|nr:hypothetical protein [Candidatus Dependentiae bacterium]